MYYSLNNSAYAIAGVCFTVGQKFTIVEIPLLLLLLFQACLIGLCCLVIVVVVPVRALFDLTLLREKAARAAAGAESSRIESRVAAIEPGRVRACQ